MCQALDHVLALQEWATYLHLLGGCVKAIELFQQRKAGYAVMIRSQKIKMRWIWQLTHWKMWVASESFSRAFQLNERL